MNIQFSRMSNLQKAEFKKMLKAAILRYSRTTELNFRTIEIVVRFLIVFNALHTGRDLCRW
jgi:hypothetical protein